jgi:hypothetical protein
VARLGTAEFATSNRTSENGEVIISYQLPTDGHSHTAAVETPAFSAGVTSNERHSKD